MQLSRKLSKIMLNKIIFLPRKIFAIYRNRNWSMKIFSVQLVVNKYGKSGCPNCLCSSIYVPKIYFNLYSEKFRTLFRTHIL